MANNDSRMRQWGQPVNVPKLVPVNAPSSSSTASAPGISDYVSAGMGAIGNAAKYAVPFMSAADNVKDFLTSPEGAGVRDAAGSAYMKARGYTDEYNSEQAAKNQAPKGDQSGAIPAPAPDQPQQQNPQAPQGAIPAPPTPGQAPTSDTQPAPSKEPSAQSVATQKKQEQDKTLKASADQASSDSAKGGGIPASPVDDPAQALATRNQNVQTGVGNQTTGLNTYQAPQMLDEETLKNAQLDQTGQDVANSMNTIGPWYQSSSFMTGMLKFGLALLDGKGYSEAFTEGSTYFDQHFGQEKRTMWANDLLKKGYNREDIEAYIETGDPKHLVSPQQRAQQQMEQNLKLRSDILNYNKGAQELAKQQYEMSPEQLQAAEEDRRIKNEYMRGQTENMRADADWKHSPEYADLQRQKLQADIDNAKARTQKVEQGVTRAGQMGGGNIVTLPTIGPDGKNLTANIGGAEVRPGWHALLDNKDRVQGDGRWMKIINPTTGQQDSMPVNTQQYQIAVTNANNTIDQLNQFSHTYGGIFTPTGDLKRGFEDLLGQRSTEDMAQMSEQLDGMTGAMAISKATLESGGYAPKEIEVETALKAFPKFGERDKNGEFHPYPMSKAQFARNVQLIGKQAAQMHAFAMKYGTPETNKAGEEESFAVYKGQRRQAPDGKWYVAMQNGNLHDPIWSLDPNQSNQ